MMHFKRKQGKLIYEYIFLMILVACVMALSFLITGHIARNYAMEQSRQSAEVIFEQAQDQIRVFEDDIDSLYTNLVNNNSVIEFFEASDLAGRWRNLEGFYQVVGNNRRINQNLQNILLYDEEGELIASKGDIFFSGLEKMRADGEAVYSDRLINSKTGEVYFEVGLPVYGENIGLGYYQTGSVYLIFDVKNFQSIVDGALPNEDSAVAILDGRQNAVVSSGKWEQDFCSYQETQEDEDNLVYVSPVGTGEWRMVSVVSKESLLSSVTMMQQVNYLTYLMVLAAMCLICGTIYERIIRPISVQTSFMAHFTQDTGQRIEVTSNNEIGEMARKMNEMLDDIEELNTRIMDSQKRYLELEYAKKQTEMIAYKSQINPHFLYNTFNCIRGMALSHGEKEISELTLSLSNFFRYSIQGDEIVTVNEALGNLQHYARIVQYRFNGKHSVIVEAPRDVFLRKIPKMLIQPLVENAVFHGLETKVEGGTVRVDVKEKEDEKGARFLEISVSDDGCGMDEETLARLKSDMAHYDEEGAIQENGHGIGFLNVYRRVRLFYGQAAGFDVESEEGRGTKITLLLPVRQEEAIV